MACTRRVSSCCRSKFYVKYADRDYDGHYDNKLLNNNMLMESTTVLSSLQSTSLKKITYHNYNLLYLCTLATDQ